MEIVLGIGRLAPARSARRSGRYLSSQRGACGAGGGRARARCRQCALGLAFHQALWATRVGNVSTTHTPVTTGVDIFQSDLVLRYARSLTRCRGVSGIVGGGPLMLCAICLFAVRRGRVESGVVCISMADTPDVKERGGSAAGTTNTERRAMLDHFGARGVDLGQFVEARPRSIQDRHGRSIE